MIIGSKEVRNQSMGYWVILSVHIVSILVFGYEHIFSFLFLCNYKIQPLERYHQEKN